MWFYVDHVYLGHQLAEAAAHDTPQGIFSDFYPRWLGAHELLLHHRNPYSPEVTRDIQIGYYGRPLDPSRPGDPKDQMAFAYPLYVIFLIAPTITFPFASLRVAVHWLFVLLTAASVPLWLGTVRWRVPLVLTAILVTLTVGTLPVVQGIKLEQLTLLVGAMIAGCALLLVSDYLVLAGILLAFATIKPQLVFLMAGWLVVWAFGDYGHRRRFIWSFALSLITLAAAADFVMPGWVGHFVNAMGAYREYTGRPVSILAVFTSSSWGLVLSALILILLAITCWRARHVPSGDPTFSRVSSLVLVATVAVIPMTSLYNQILLLPAVLVLIRYGALLWGKDRLTRVACIIVVSLMVWPWLAALALSLAFLIAPTELAQKYWAAPLWTSMTIPLGVLLLLAQLSLTNPNPSIAKAQPFESPRV
jgi:Glycosyltransferase family 87